MKVMLIDPWCYNGSNLYYYTTGLATELGKMVDLTLVTHNQCTLPNEINCTHCKVFFPNSDKMKRNRFRSLIRGLEYIYAYKAILRMLKETKYDVVHIEWPLLYKVDYHYYKKIKKNTRMLVLKAHNILPHSSGMKYFADMGKLYDVSDVVLLHGEKMSAEFASLYPEYSHKALIQRHGTYMNHDTHYDESLVDNSVVDFVQKHERIYLFFGLIHFDKGVDRLVEIWNSIQKSGNSGLIIIGRVDPSYTDFIRVKNVIGESQDIFFRDEYVDNNLMNYLFSKSNIVVLPYRGGSMSGVAFSCAEFEIPLIATDFGVISEYVEDNVTGYIVDNDDETLRKKLQYLESNVSNTELKDMGKKHKHKFYSEYSWEKIAEDLVKNKYSAYLNRKQYE